LTGLEFISKDIDSERISVFCSRVLRHA